jgi:hypothetical protein
MHEIIYPPPPHDTHALKTKIFIPKIKILPSAAAATENTYFAAAENEGPIHQY